MPSPRQYFGAECERLAEKVLLQQGYHIVHRNWRVRGGEVDRIAWSEGVLVFIEIRSRSSLVGGSPFDSINRKKRKKLVRAAEIYLSYLAPEQVPMVRFDVIGILSTSASTNTSRVTLIKNAFDGFAEVI